MEKIKFRELTTKAGTTILAGKDEKSNEKDRKSTRLNSSHTDITRMPSSA